MAKIGSNLRIIALGFATLPLLAACSYSAGSYGAGSYGAGSSRYGGVYETGAAQQQAGYFGGYGNGAQYGCGGYVIYAPCTYYSPPVYNWTPPKVPYEPPAVYQPAPEPPVVYEPEPAPYVDLECPYGTVPHPETNSCRQEEVWVEPAPAPMPVPAPAPIPYVELNCPSGTVAHRESNSCRQIASTYTPPVVHTYPEHTYVQSYVPIKK